MASESWEDQAVVVEPPEIKLFGQWSAQDVQVGDISLTVSIPPGPDRSAVGVGCLVIAWAN